MITPIPFLDGAEDLGTPAGLGFPGGTATADIRSPERRFTTRAASAAWRASSPSAADSAALNPAEPCADSAARNSRLRVRLARSDSTHIHCAAVEAPTARIGGFASFSRMKAAVRSQARLT